MGAFSFLKLSKDRTERNYKLLCLACWGIGGVIYTINLVDTLLWTATYPHPNFMAGSAWLQNLASRLFCMWLPMGFLLLEWKSQKLSLILYIVGGIAAILLSLGSIGLLLPYVLGKDGYMLSEYDGLVKSSLESGSFPSTMKAALSIEECCAWYGAADFGQKYNLAKQVDKNEKFMQQISSCAGNLFDVKLEESGMLKYTQSSHSGNSIPPGCGIAYYKRANRISIINIIMTLFICCATPVLLVFHVRLYKKLVKGTGTEVTPATEQEVRRAQSDTLDTESKTSSAAALKNDTPDE